MDKQRFISTMSAALFQLNYKNELVPRTFYLNFDYI